MDCSTPGFPVHHQLLEPTQTHVHCVGDAIQPSHPLSSPSPPAFHLSQHQGLFQWVSSSHELAKVLELQLQHQSFQWIFRSDFLQDWLVWSPCSPRNSQESSPTPQFKSIHFLYDVILLPVGLSCMAFISLRYVPSTPILVSIFNHKCWILSKVFLHLLRWSYNFYCSIC